MYNPTMHITRRMFLGATSLAPFAVKAATLSEVHVSVLTDEIDEDLAHDADFLKGFGIRWAELRSIWGKYNTAQPMEKIREARAILDAAQIKTSVAGTAFFRIPLPPEGAAGQAILDKQWTLLNDAMDRAEVLGTDRLRIFAFMSPKEGTTSEKDYQRIYELLDEAGKRAKVRNVKLAVENLGGSCVSTGAQSAKMLKAVKQASVGLTWDPNNAAESGEKPFPDGYRLLDPARIYNVHIRDFRHTPDGKVEWMAVGEGEADNLGQIRALLKDGYQGRFNLETHYKSPKGKEFATRTSLTGLLKVVEKV
jgi:sugar phosphate isomerase/epimerase